MPAFDVMARLCGSARVHLDWLATGNGPMLASAVAAPSGASGGLVRPDPDTLRDALEFTDRTLAMLHREADAAGRAHLVAMAYDIMSQQTSVPEALRELMEAVESGTGESPDVETTGRFST